MPENIGQFFTWIGCWRFCRRACTPWCGLCCGPGRPLRSARLLSRKVTNKGLALMGSLRKVEMLSGKLTSGKDDAKG